MKKRYAVLLLGSLVLALSGCHTEVSRIQPGETTRQRNQERTGETDRTDEAEVLPGQTGEEVTGADSAYAVGKKGDDYILPDVQSHVYLARELSELTREELRLARNEIYARHGRKFKSDDLNRYFSERSWYQASVEPDQFDDSVLSQNEKDNLKVIQDLEAGIAVCSIPRMGTEEFPKVDGSTATIPISQAMYRMATGASQKEAEAAITHGKTTQAWLSLIEGEDYWDGGSSLVIAYEPGDAVQKALKEAGDNIIMKPIGRDALVFLANRSNPVHSLTDRQIVDIYSGKTANWKDVGGKDSRIQAFQRPENSGSQNLMDKLVMKGKQMAAAPKDQVVSEMGELLEEVSAYDDTGEALGYSVYYYARNMYQKPELTFMAVNGVMPSNETIRDKSYPFVNDFYAAIRADAPKDSREYELFEWLTGEDGQSLINGLGYVGVGTAAKELPKELLEPEETFDASIPLPEGQVILGSGPYLYGEQGLAVFDSRMKLLQFISHVQCEDVGVFLECSRDSVLPMTDTRTGEDGYYSIGANKWVDGKGQGDDLVYEKAHTFAADHPELLSKYGVTEQEVETCYYWESARPIMVIKEGNIEHYYDPFGQFLLDYDTQGRSEDKLPYRYVVALGDHMAYIRLDRELGTVEDDDVRYLIYKNGVLLKELSEQAGSISDISNHFYTRTYGNYLYFYNYQDEPCAKFLYGYYGND